jgi:uncharacterized coiled-coil DUF342 family protein
MFLTKWLVKQLHWKVDIMTDYMDEILAEVRETRTVSEGLFKLVDALRARVEELEDSLDADRVDTNAVRDKAAEIRAGLDAIQADFQAVTQGTKAEGEPVYQPSGM